MSGDTLNSAGRWSRGLQFPAPRTGDILHKTRISINSWINVEHGYLQTKRHRQFHEITFNVLNLLPGWRGPQSHKTGPLSPFRCHSKRSFRTFVQPFLNHPVKEADDAEKHREIVHLFEMTVRRGFPATPLQTGQGKYEFIDKLLGKLPAKILLFLNDDLEKKQSFFRRS